MQSEADNDASLCIETLEGSSSAIYGMTQNLMSSGSYYAGHKIKGDGVGSDAGWYISNVNGMLGLSTEFMNLYKECSFDYYFQSFGAATQSIDGFMSMGVSLIFRAFMDDNTQFNKDMDSEDAVVVAKATGLFVKGFFQVEIPSVNLEKG